MASRKVGKRNFPIARPVRPNLFIPFLFPSIRTIISKECGSFGSGTCAGIKNLQSSSGPSIKLAIFHSLWQMDSRKMERRRVWMFHSPCSYRSIKNGGSRGRMEIEGESKDLENCSEKISLSRWFWIHSEIWIRSIRSAKKNTFGLED